MGIKEIFLQSEGNAWLLRNQEGIRNRGEHQESHGFQFVSEFLKSQGVCGEQFRVLEVGSSYGYNLNYLHQELDGIKTFGIEPSELAVEKGNSLYGGGTPCSKHRRQLAL